jgi:hypothetical protein
LLVLLVNFDHVALPTMTTNRKPSSKRLHWRGRTVHFGNRVLATIVPDDTYPAMWRVKLPDGQLTDMANITWTRERAIGLALEAISAGSTPARTCRKPPQEAHTFDLVERAQSNGL